MILVIDEFNSITGFTAYNTASIVNPENEIKDFIAGADNTKSVQFKFENSGDYIEKAGLNIDVSEYNYIICHFYSNFNKYTKGKYKISFNDQHEFEINLYNYMIDQYFSLKEIGTITKIKIEYIGEKEDFLLVSHCLAVLDELPVDIFKAVKLLVEKEINETIDKGFFLGTIDTIAGDEQIALNQINDTNLTYIDRYSVIEIEDITNSEQHVLDENDERFFNFGKLLDGQQIVNNFTAGNVHLKIPVRYGVNQFDYNCPSVSITGYTPTAILRGGTIEEVHNTVEEGTDYTRQDDQIFEWQIDIACITRVESDIMSFMSKIIRTVISRKKLWINGQKYGIFFIGEPEFIQLTDAENPITGLIYKIKLEIKEEIWKNIKKPKLTAQNLSATPRN